MFAFAIWDEDDGSLLLVRDRLGIKPLYYSLQPDGSLFFASEIKAMVEAGMVQPTLNLRVLPDLLANHAPSGDETLFEGVRRLPPGHALKWKNGAVTLQEYWRLDPCGPELPGAESALQEEFEWRLEEAVQMRLMADVPLSYKVHILSAFALLGFSPFSRLVHIWSAPFFYIFRSPIVFRRRVQDV